VRVETCRYKTNYNQLFVVLTVINKSNTVAKRSCSPCGPGSASNYRTHIFVLRYAIRKKRAVEITTVDIDGRLSHVLTTSCMIHNFIFVL
jgi:hypothetical protein